LVHSFGEAGMNPANCNGERDEEVFHFHNLNRGGRKGSGEPL
jgi:hypothetical protein